MLVCVTCLEVPLSFLLPTWGSIEAWDRSRDDTHSLSSGCTLLFETLSVDANVAQCTTVSLSYLLWLMRYPLLERGRPTVFFTFFPLQSFAAIQTQRKEGDMRICNLDVPTAFFDVPYFRSRQSVWWGFSRSKKWLCASLIMTVTAITKKQLVECKGPSSGPCLVNLFV